MRAEDFLKQIGPAVQASAKNPGMPASFTVAEAAMESGWGLSLRAGQGKNLFGIMVAPSWLGDVLTLDTCEFLHGTWVMVPARWRNFATGKHAWTIMRRSCTRTAGTRRVSSARPGIPWSEGRTRAGS